MNPVVLYFASGESFYLGTALLLALAASSIFPLPQFSIRIHRIGGWVALVLMVMASPPFSVTTDVIFGSVFLLWTIASNRTESGRIYANLRILAASTLIIFMVGLLSQELSRRKAPVVQGLKSSSLVIIGDSISAGIGNRVRPWPDVMQQTTGVKVTNLSRPGATMSDGLAIADRVDPRNHLVLIELGGNDLLAGEPLRDFVLALDEVLGKLSVPGRTLVMFELPLLPEMIPYGRAQRRLAKKYGVCLIPKRFFARIISGSDATSDGLHLSEVGARRMAALVTEVLSPVLEKQALVVTTPATHP